MHIYKSINKLFLICSFEAELSERPVLASLLGLALQRKAAPAPPSPPSLPTFHSMESLYRRTEPEEEMVRC